MTKRRRVGRHVAGLVVIGAWILSPGLLRSEMLQDLGATFQRTAQELAAAFPKVEARVVARAEDEVRLEGPGVPSLRPGLELSVYRKGAPFRHPVTNQVLGQSEQEIGTVVVTSVQGEQASARVVAREGGPQPGIGDGARISAGRLTVAVLPPTGVPSAAEASGQTAHLLVARFSALLEKTGRFQTVDPQRVLDAVVAGAGGAVSPLDVARRLGVPAVLTSRVALEGRQRYLETTWTSARTGAALASSRTALVRAAFPPRFAWEQTPELERRIALEGGMRGLALGDLDGDGRLEAVVADERTVTVYRWQDGGGLTPLGLPMRTGGVVLSVDAADVNGIGRAQLIVVDHRGEGTGVGAAVLELEGARLRTLYETRGRYLRVVTVAGEPWLLEQQAGQSEPFEPTVRRLRWQGDGYRDAGALRVPRGVTIYGLALVRLTGSPDPEVVALTADDRLTVWTAKGQRLWTSAEALGGAAVTWDHTPLNAGRSQVGLDLAIGRILGRVIPLPPTSEGPEVLVFENVLPLVGQARGLLPRVASTLFNQGRVHRLRWKDGGFVRVWQSATTEGYIADYGFGDLDGDGIPEVVVGVVPRGLNLETLNPLARTRAHLVVYELP